MTPFKKYIRPGVLRQFLRKALALAGTQCAFAIDYEGEICLVEGADSMDAFEDGDHIILVSAIRFDDIHAGAVKMRLPLGVSDADQAQHQRTLSFTAYSLQEIIDMERARRLIADEALAKYRELALLHRSVPAINTSLQMREVVGSLITECRRENYPGEVSMVFLSEPGSSQFRLAVQYGLPFMSELQDVADSELFNAVVRSGKGEIINDLQADGRWNDELPGLKSMLIIPIISPNRCEGMLIIASENKGLFEAAHRQSLSTLASVAGISVSNAFNFEGVQRLMNALLQALAEAIDSRDQYTAGHSERVANLAVAFAYAAGEAGGVLEKRYTDSELREMYYAGVLHDVGKIGIKEDVLTKDSRLPQRKLDVVRSRLQLHGQMTGSDWKVAFERVKDINKSMTPEAADLAFIKELGQTTWQVGEESYPLLYEDELEVLSLEYGNLTREEREEIQRHPAESERILQHIPLPDEYGDMLTIIRQHHERIDGSGYPDGLRGSDIMMQSQLMAIVDIYDAVTQERHYKPAFTRREAMNILSKDAEQGKLDKQLVAFFNENLKKIESLSERVKGTRITHLSEIGNFIGL